MTLYDRIMKCAAFDTSRAAKDAQHPWNSNPSDCHFVGMKHENKHLRPLIEALAKSVNVLEWYAMPWNDSEPEPHMAKEALAKLTAEIERMEK